MRLQQMVGHTKRKRQNPSVMQPVTPSDGKKSDYNLILEKLRVLEDFYIVTNKEERERMKKHLTYELKVAVEKNPTADHRVLLDAIARPLVQAKINSWK